MFYKSFCILNLDKQSGNGFMSCILCQQTLRGELGSQEERGKTLLYSHKEASGGWQKRTRKLPCYTRCAYRHKNAEAFLNKGGKGTRAGVARRQ